MNNSIETVRVNLAERSYDIEIGAGNLAEAGRFLADRAKVTHVVLITDDHVQKPHAMRVAESLGEQDIEVDVIVVEPGEESKSLDVAAGLWQGLLDLGADRKTVVAAVGGGVVGDLAGFIAATYARGLRFLQVPTSLLAQVDSSVGGKVGINLPEAKNMVGAFLQPLGVLIDTATLATLPANEYRAGLAEVVKYGVILDAEFFAVSRSQRGRLDRAQGRRAGPRDCPLLPSEGRRGRKGRAGGERAAGRAELRPHVRPRLRDAFAATARCCTARRWPSAWSAPRDWPNGSAASMPSSPPGSHAPAIARPAGGSSKLDPEKILDAMMHDKKVAARPTPLRPARPHGPGGTGGRHRPGRHPRGTGRRVDSYNAG